MANYAIDYNGSNQYAYNTSIDLPGDTWTVECKVKWGYNGAPGAQVGFCTTHTYNSSGPQIYLGFQSNGKMFAYIGGNFVYDTLARTWVLDTWYDVAYSYDNNANYAYFFQNGTASAISTGQGCVSQSAWYIATGYNSRFNGGIDEMRLSKICRYTSSYTPSESEYTVDANTYALWHFNEGSGTPADATSNHFDLTLNNSPTWIDGYPFIYNVPPATPTNSTPTNGATNQSRNPTLSASAFSDDDVGDTHAASQWLVATDSGFSDQVWDSGEDASNLTSTTVNTTNGSFTGSRAGKARLASNTEHYWKVRYKDSFGNWSAYS